MYDVTYNILTLKEKLKK